MIQEKYQSLQKLGIRIRESTFDKLRRYNELLYSEFRKEIELYGYLCGAFGSGIIEDCFLASHQKGNEDGVLVKPEGVREAFNLLNRPQNYVINGWFHNHPKEKILDFSQKDEQNCRVVLSIEPAILEFDDKKINYSYAILTNSKSIGRITVLDEEGMFHYFNSSIVKLPGGKKFRDQDLTQEIIQKLGW